MYKEDPNQLLLFPLKDLPPAPAQFTANGFEKKPSAPKDETAIVNDAPAVRPESVTKVLGRPPRDRSDVLLDLPDGTTKRLKKGKSR